jgi:hypothetical protein
VEFVDRQFSGVLAIGGQMLGLEIFISDDENLSFVWYKFTVQSRAKIEDRLEATMRMGEGISKL